MKRLDTNSKTISFIAILILITLGLLVFYYSENVLVNTDSQRYTILANNFILGRGFSLNGYPELVYSLGYSMFLVPLIFFGVSLPLSVSLLSVIFYSLLGFSVFLVVSAKHNKLIGLFTSLFIIINGNIILWTMLGDSEILMVPLLVFSYFFITKKKEHIAGIFAGLAYLVKPEALFYAGIFLFIALINNKNYKKFRIKNFLMSVLIFMVPYVMYLYINTGTISLSGKSATIFWDRYIEDSSFVREQYVYKLNSDNSVGLDNLRAEHLGIDLTRRIRVNVLRYKQSVFELLLPFNIVSVFLILIFVFKKNIRGTIIFLGLLCLPTLTTLLFHLENRYLISLLIFGVGILSLAGKDLFIKKSHFVQKVISILSLSLLAGVTYYSFLPIHDRYDNLVLEKSKIENFIFQNQISSNVILSRKPVYSFYAQKDYYPLPWTKEEKLLEKYLDSNADATVILDDWSYNSIPTTDKILREKRVDHKNIIINEN